MERAADDDLGDDDSPPWHDGSTRARVRPESLTYLGARMSALADMRHLPLGCRINKQLRENWTIITGEVPFITAESANEACPVSRTDCSPGIPPGRDLGVGGNRAV